MLQPLPAETVFEAKQRTKRATYILFILLCLIYVLFFNLISIIIFVSFGKNFFLFVSKNFWLFNIAAVIAAILSAGFHFHSAKKKPLEEILKQLNTIPTDPKDEYHKIFINIVQEAETATGIRPILPVIIPSTGCNAFSVEDGSRNAAIGTTEGLLAKLDRSELTAVISHEAAHLVHGDSKLATIVSSLLETFDRFRLIFKKSKIWNVLYRTRTAGYLALARPFLWFLATVGHGITRFIYMAISRKREFFADADGVYMCKDPLSLAEALYKISQRYRGSFDVAEGFSSLFILNPQVLSIDEEQGFFANLFSTHPPVADRLKKLMTWAKTDVIEIKQDLKIEKNLIETIEESPRFFAHIKEKWEGPFTPLQILALDTIKPSTWVCATSDDKIVRAGDNELLLQLFIKRMSGVVSRNQCPRCNVPLVEMRYEGTFTLHCNFCSGDLLKYGVLEKMIVRKDREFSKDEIEKTKIWRKLQKVNMNEFDGFPNIKCPLCGSVMAKMFHTMLTAVVIDSCFNKGCRVIWCDGGELEKIQILVEDAEKI